MDFGPLPDGTTIVGRLVASIDHEGSPFTIKQHKTRWIEVTGEPQYADAAIHATALSMGLRAVLTKSNRDRWFYFIEEIPSA